MPKFCRSQGIPLSAQASGLRDVPFRLTAPTRGLREPPDRMIVLGRQSVPRPYRLAASEECMAKRATLRRADRTVPLSLRDLSSTDLRRLEASSRRWQERLEPHREAIVESERLTEADLRVRINTKR